MNRKSLHIFPFFTKHKGMIKTKYCDLSENEIEVRGLPLIKEKLEDDVPLYLNNKKIEEEVFYWKIDKIKIENSGNEKINFIDNKSEFKKNDLFEEGLILTRKGIGF